MKILADIGGTYARFALCGEQGDGQNVQAIKKYEAAQFESFEAALEVYAQEQGIEKAPLRIATAAYPDENGHWRFVNNNPWVIDPEALGAGGWPIEIIINDFEAATYGLIDLPEDAQRVLKAGAPRAGFAKCLAGPGTGLGLGYLHAGGRVQKTHGGHMLATAAMQEHWDVIQAVSKALGRRAVFENLVSGPGLYNIYSALCEKPEAGNAAEMLENVDAPHVKDTLRLFHEFLGLFARTVVVSGHAYGGLYLTGGVLERLTEKQLFDFTHFETFFILAGVESVTLDLENTPIIHIADSYLALHGLLTAPVRNL